jgi:hypothetical protein
MSRRAACSRPARGAPQLVIENGPGGLQAMTTPGSAQRTIECEKSLIGRVVGSRGSTIADLEQRSGARLTIDQGRDPAIITVRFEWAMWRLRPRTRPRWKEEPPPRDPPDVGALALLISARLFFWTPPLTAHLFVRRRATRVPCQFRR